MQKTDLTYINETRKKAMAAVANMKLKTKQYCYLKTYQFYYVAEISDKDFVIRISKCQKYVLLRP
jgi:hypothetical protein